MGSNWIVPVFAAIIAAWMTAQLAFHRFRREQVFERKLDAYTELFAAVHEMQKSCGIWMHYIRTGQPFSNTTKIELHGAFSDARDKLSNVLYSRLWLISDRYIKRLEEMNLDINSGAVADRIMPIANRATQSALIDLRLYVREELELDEWLWRLKRRAER